ncbi:1-acyl-sn-glycerol-3-phosphate acyltransferase [Aporhodopirellula aestuarii]|uniref:1-acyl-sn-glycerol-3-phosphate acyltransferase n=1 Tax=Aporhodopirellula aestuarii TaxID=2950107 RepID=A0ABT0UBW5_9BACT|nr:1-acyl-sn-glycerol-3-phosphate acyltransferase [Aporhodopirellula aestuarii]MCM2373826.1 1-acyl-sn-glycerol-3-phosphate acyltransferase [Aporhodopirellula aestuarii]
MTVILERPYTFVPPHRGNLWPTAIQKLRLIDRHLRNRESVVSYELRHADRLAESLAAGHGIVLAPNHCRYADPIVLGWLARQVNTHLYAMASWHLFNTNSFEAFALRRMGAFSIYREGNDRQAIETSIEIIANAERPLVLFPEGTTNRTNDLLKPLLDGVSFIARAAAKKREKAGLGKVVMHPVGLKYLCVGDAWKWADEKLRDLEVALSWQPRPASTNPQAILERLFRVSEAYLALKEIEHVGKASAGDLRPRRDELIHFLLSRSESRYGLPTVRDACVRERVRKVRAAVATAYFAPDPETGAVIERDPAQYRIDSEAADLAQFLLSFPDQYLTPGQITDTRIVETIQRIQEAIYGKANETMPMSVIIEVDHAIEVSSKRGPRGEPDPLLCQLESRLRTMMEALSKEARDFEQTDHAVSSR